MSDEQFVAADAVREWLMSLSNEDRLNHTVEAVLRLSSMASQHDQILEQAKARIEALEAKFN